MIPMQGVQPMAKIAPRPNDASHPPRALTIRPPSRSAIVELPPVPRLIELVAVASEPAAPASKGRHVRSSAAIRRMPARLSPKTIRIRPPTIRSAGR
jgi:hypothetical protein